MEVGDKLKSLLEDPEKFADFEALSYWETRFSNAIAIATFLAWIKVCIWGLPRKLCRPSSFTAVGVLAHSKGGCAPGIRM